MIRSATGTVPAGSDHRRRLRRAFAGREKELARIAEMMEQPEVAGVALVGDDGVGKTRLLGEALSRCDPDRFACVGAATVPVAPATPFAAFAAVLPAALLTSPLSGYALGVAAETLLRAAADRRLVLAVDDVHLLDEASLVLVAQLARRGDAFLLTTLRRGVLLPDPVASLWSGGFADWIEVSALDRRDVADLLTTTLDGQVEGLLVQRFWVATAGNSLLLREVIAAQLEAGTLRRDGGLWRMNAPFAVPPRLVRLIDERLRPLPASCRHAMELLAFGEPLSPDVLRRLVPAAALETAEARGLIRVEDADGQERTRLAYPLYGEVLRACTPRLLAQRRRDELLGVVGHRDSGSAETPPPVSVVAATWAAWSEQDLPGTERLARLAVSCGTGAAVAEPLGYSLMLGGRAAEAEELLAGLVGAGTDDAVRLAAVRVVNRCVGLSRADEAAELLRVCRAGISDRSARAELDALGALLDVVAGDTTPALRQASEVLAGGSRLARATAPALVAQGLAMVFLDRPREGAGALAEARELAGRPGGELPWLDALIEIGLVHACLWDGDLAQARQRAAEGYARAVAVGAQLGIAAFCLLRALVAWLRGAVREQLHYCREGIATVRDCGPQALLPVLFAALAHGLASAGEPVAAQAALADADSVHNRSLAVLAPWIELARTWVRASADPSGFPPASRAVVLAGDTGSVGFEALALHDLVRLGAPDRAVDRLRQLSTRGAAASLYAAHALSAATRDGDALGVVSVRLERLGSPLLAAEAAAAQSRCYRADGRLNLASVALARSMSLARSCERLAWVPALNQTERPRITPREHQIAAMAARGLSSKEISQHFVLSVRTVENHLQRVYRKLGIGTRAELAALRGLFPGWSGPGEVA